MSDARGKELKILMVIGLFHPVVGGAEKACQTLSKRLMGKGISVTILTQYRDGLPEQEIIDGIPVYRKMKGWHPFGLTYMFSVLSFLIKNRECYDIIQCFGLFLFIPPAILMKYFCDKKVVLRLLCSGACGDFVGIEQLTFKRLIIVAARHCDRIIYLSQAIKQELLEHHFVTEKLACIPNGVDVERFVPLKRSEGQDSKNICFVGRIEAQKGLEFLIKAMCVVLSQQNDVKLFIVGSGKQRVYLEDLCRRLELDEHITFVGKQANVLSYYHQSGIVILPSESEGMSNVLLEAMACALPIVTTDIEGNVELVGKRKTEMINGSGGRYFICENGISISPQDVDSLAEAIVRLLRDRRLAKSMGHSARKKVEESYSINQVTGQYTALYKTL